MWAAPNSGYTMDDGCNEWMTLQHGKVCTAHVRGGQEGIDPGTLVALLDVWALMLQRRDEGWW